MGGFCLFLCVFLISFLLSFLLVGAGQVAPCCQSTRYSERGQDGEQRVPILWPWMRGCLFSGHGWEDAYSVAMDSHGGCSPESLCGPDTGSTYAEVSTDRAVEEKSGAILDTTGTIFGIVKCL